MVVVCVELKMMLNSADREEASRPRSAVGLASCFTRDVIGLEPRGVVRKITFQSKLIFFKLKIQI